MAVFKLKKGDIAVTRQEVVADSAFQLMHTTAQPKFLSFSKYFWRNTTKEDANSEIFFGTDLIKDNKVSGGIAELIVYNQLLSEEKQQRVECYLSMKYGISLPSDENYIDSDGEVIFTSVPDDKFVNHITAVGRDDNTSFGQLKSRNLYSDVHFSLQVSNNNQGEVADIFDDKEYIFWSCNIEDAILDLSLIHI